MEAIRTKGLTKKYKDTVAVDHLDLTVEQGELLALIGVNGAGKTTTVKMLSCLTLPTEGEAFVGGHNVVSEAGAVKAIIGVSPQETAVAPQLTVRENLSLLCGAYGMTKAATEQAVAAMAERFDLGAVLGKKAGKLSGGWQRRLSIAMALIGEPSILFLDEPTLGLDVLARRELWDIIRALKGTVTVVLTTHYMEEAEELSDRVAVMRDGRMLACGTARQLEEQTGTGRLEAAFVALVKEGSV